MSDVLWASLAFIGFAGWTVTLVYLMRNILPMANALGALQKISGFVDDRIATQLERAKRVWDAKGMPTTQQEKQRPPQVQKINEVNEIENLFGPEPFEPFGEQPEPEGGVEIIE